MRGRSSGRRRPLNFEGRRRGGVARMSTELVEAKAEDAE